MSIPGSMAPKKVIGSYSDPKNRKQEQAADTQIMDKRSQVETPASKLSEGIQENLKQDLAETKTTAEKVKTYEEILKENEISLVTARAIVDDLLSKGFYEERLSVTQNVSVTFRTRQQKDYKRYLQALELYNPKFVDEQAEIQMRYYLAASLVSFKGQLFDHPDDDVNDNAFHKRLEWIEKQPERLITLLVTKLNQFDTKISIVMSEGVVENF